MSITFSIRDLDGSYSYRCDCSQRWCDACDLAWSAGESAPEMFSCENCTSTEINMANSNALDFLKWVGVPFDYCGEIAASDLAARCRRRLWNEERNLDPAIPPCEDGRIIYGGRRAGYLRERTEQMLALCEKAGERMICWG